MKLFSLCSQSQSADFFQLMITAVINRSTSKVYFKRVISNEFVDMEGVKASITLAELVS